MPPKPGIHPDPPRRARATAPRATTSSTPCRRASRHSAPPASSGSPLPGNCGARPALHLRASCDTEGSRRTGMPKAVMDATWITPMRTGAATAVRRQAPGAPGVRRAFGISAAAPGAPPTSRRSPRSCRRFREVRPTTSIRRRTAGYVSEMRARFPRPGVRPAPAPRAAVEGCDIVVTAGPIRARPTPTIEADWFAAGTLGVPLDYDSYWTPEAMRRADRFYNRRHGAAPPHQDGKRLLPENPEDLRDLGEVIAASGTAAATPASGSSA